jgi:hypothetical protein
MFWSDFFEDPRRFLAAIVLLIGLYTGFGSGWAVRTPHHFIRGKEIPPISGMWRPVQAKKCFGPGGAKVEFGSDVVISQDAKSYTIAPHAQYFDNGAGNIAIEWAVEVSAGINGIGRWEMALAGNQLKQIAHYYNGVYIPERLEPFGKRPVFERCSD